MAVSGSRAKKDALSMPKAAAESASVEFAASLSPIKEGLFPPPPPALYGELDAEEKEEKGEASAGPKLSLDVEGEGEEGDRGEFHLDFFRRLAPAQ